MKRNKRNADCTELVVYNQKKKSKFIYPVIGCVIGGVALSLAANGLNYMDNQITELTKRCDNLILEQNRLSELLVDYISENEDLKNQIDELIEENKMTSNDLTNAERTIKELTETIIAQEQQLSELEFIAGSLPVFNPYDITELSNLSYEQLCIITTNTRWVGYEEKLLELENKYGVNVIFAIANSIMECGRTEMTGYAKRNNFFGINNATFQSVESCLEYYFRIIREFYINTSGLITVESIQPVYCPPNDKWDDGIISIGMELLSKLNLTSE